MIRVCHKYIFIATAAVLLLAIGSCNQTQQSTQIIEHISAREGYDLIQENLNNQNFTIIDVRTPAEFAEEHIEMAINIDFYSDTFRDDIDKLNKDNTYLIYCRSGNRSGQALSSMGDLGFKEVYDMGGIIEWKAEGFPIVK